VLKLRFRFNSIIGLTKSVIRHRRLVLEMSKRELTDKYAGQVFGWTWAVLHPIILMGVYVFVFTVVFKQGIGRTTDFPLDYTAYVVTGLVCWLNIQDSLSRSTSAVTSKSELVKQVVFPIEILPVKATLASLVPMCVSLTVLLTYIGIRFGLKPATLILGPLAVGIQFLFLTGIGYFLSSLAVFIRDVKDFVLVFLFAGVYIIPAFYLPEWTPNLFRPLLNLNPFSYLIWIFQDAFFYGHIKHPRAWVIASSLSCLSFITGQMVFNRLKSAFGNFL